MDVLSDILQQINLQYGIHITLRDIILLGMSPIFVATFVFEYVYLKQKGIEQQFISIKESILNFSLGASYQVVEALANILFLAIVLKWIESFQLHRIPVDSFSLALVLFVLQEFFYYWYHRCGHRVRWFWAAHVVHHSSTRMNFSTAMRQSVMYPILGGNFLFFSPLILIGFSAEAVFACYAINLAYQYFVHTQLVDKLHPWIEFVFNTPSHHRIHHGCNARYIDKNYGGVLIVFDRLFGTFEEENEAEAVEFGIVKQIHSLNLLTVNFHEWRDMFTDMLKPGTITQRIKHCWKPPEWTR